MAGSFVTNYNVGGEIDVVKSIGKIGQINHFASKGKPYNKMHMFDIPATEDDFTFEIPVYGEACEILALTVTCSGYHYKDCYDLYFNDDQWFCDWYCSETKEGLYMGSSTYVYAAEANSKITLVFKNRSGTSKKIWLGIRMLID